MNNYVVKMKTASGKTRYYCYNDGSGFNTTFFIDSAARLSKSDAEKEVKNFTNAEIALFADEKKKRFVEAEVAIKRMEEKKQLEEDPKTRYYELEKYWGKELSSKKEHVVKVKPIEIKVKSCSDDKKIKEYHVDAISYEIKNIIKSLTKIDELLTCKG